MVEMTEVAELSSTPPPEPAHPGRDRPGTSTYDGMAIARAVLEWCANPPPPGGAESGRFSGT